MPDKLKNAWLIVTSTLFYWWGAPTFIYYFLLSCLLDYYVAILFSKKNKKVYYYIAIIANVILLLYFKYFNFFISNINDFFDKDIDFTKIALPIGISFLTFQKISYLVDVYRKDCDYQPYFHRYLLFVVLFPQLIAGLIVRYKEISEQLTNRFNQINSTTIYLGLRRFIIGLSKKVLIANILGEVVDQIFKLPTADLSSYTAMMGLLAYTFQIYFDFSGYSDMAIGLGKMMGFSFPENFNFPYISKSITEFWRRWHITLSSWMRDYLYIPLGGNKKGSKRTYINLVIVFLISGLWHGASWNFVLWGAFHGFFLVLERLFLLKFLDKIPSLFKVLYCFVVVSIGWLLFRANNLTDAMDYFSAIINNFHVIQSNTIVFTSKFYVIFCLAIFFSFMGFFNEKQLNELNLSVSNSFFKLASSHLSIIVLLALCLGELFSSGFNPFIYFRF